eukprot:5981202-Prymnesium_polylepis.1
MVDGRDDICCICCMDTGALIKPLWVTGEQACCKNASKGGCCASKCSCPFDEDVPGRCGCCPIFCCPLSFGCPSVQPMTEESWGGYELEAKTPNPGQEYMCCAFPCYVSSIYIPDKPADALGEECNCALLCLECKCLMHMLPARDDGRE